MAQTPSPAATPAASVKVVATFSILGDWVQQVGGDRIELVTLVGAGGDAHTFDPSPDEAAQLAGADLIVEVGAEFEPWLNDLVAAADAPARRVAITDGLDLIPLAEDADGHDAEEHEHAAGDPHVWHDVANAIASVETIRDALSAIDAANAPVYAVNAGRYIEELRALDREIRGQTATLPEERRRLVTSHDTFAYYARAYGFEIVGTALGSVTTEAGEPSAQQFASLVEQIEAAGVPAIFAENVANPDLMQSIADEAGVTLAPPLYTDALSEPSGPAATYIALMRTNTTTIVTALAA
ncbi:MAG: zinc ABC transporter substrate-binding protein [Chloroflexota bacterium]|nr:zinc ABC transporter substrate-binding protein [Chloroflexota bacterium]